MTPKELHEMSKFGSEDGNAFSVEKISVIVMIHKLLQGVKLVFVVAGGLLQVLAVPELKFSLLTGALLVPFVPAGHQVGVEIGGRVEKVQHLDRPAGSKEAQRFVLAQIEAKAQRFEVAEFGDKVYFCRSPTEYQPAQVAPVAGHRLQSLN